MLTVIVCGGRDYADREAIYRSLDALIPRGLAGIIHGDARGADRIAGDWARLRGVPCTAVPADWEREGKAAGPRRNERMLEMRPGGVVAFPGGRGTAHMVAIAEAAGVNVWRPYG